jgi:hypothetical protein
MKWLCRHKLNQPPPSIIILNRTLVMRYYFHHYQKHHVHPISHAVEYNFHLRLKLSSFHARQNCSLLEDESYLFPPPSHLHLAVGFPSMRRTSTSPRKGHCGLASKEDHMGATSPSRYIIGRKRLPLPTF